MWTGYGPGLPTGSLVPFEALQSDLRSLPSHRGTSSAARFRDGATLSVPYLPPGDGRGPRDPVEPKVPMPDAPGPALAPMSGPKSIQGIGLHGRWTGHGADHPLRNSTMPLHHVAMRRGHRRVGRVPAAEPVELRVRKSGVGARQSPKAVGRLTTRHRLGAGWRNPLHGATCSTLRPVGAPWKQVLITRPPDFWCRPSSCGADRLLGAKPRGVKIIAAGLDLDECGP
jgi:hypothetical protein